MKKYLILLAVAVILYSYSGNTSIGAENFNKAIQDNVQAYLDNYNKKYQELCIIDNEAQWRSNTHIVEGDSTNATATNKAEEEMAKFTGSTENIQNRLFHLDLR